MYQYDPQQTRCSPLVGLTHQLELLWTDLFPYFSVQVKIVVLRHIRKSYRPTCTCPGTRPLLVASPPPKLIPKGKFTVQTRVKFLLDKYLAQIPVNRQCLLLAQAGLPVCKGTIHGGFDVLQASSRHRAADPGLPQ